MGRSTAEGINEVGLKVSNAFKDPKAAGTSFVTDIRGSKADPFGNSAAEKKRLSEAENLANTDIVTDTTNESSTISDSSTTGTSQTTFDPKSAQEQALLDSSIANFGRQESLVGQQEADIASRGNLQTQGRDVLSGIASGDAFAATGAEQGRIDALRSSELAIGQQQVGGVLTERLAQLEADAQRRGIRGQAFSQLQTGALGEAAQSTERQVLEANRLAAQRSNDIVGQRTGLQAQVGQNLSTFQSDARQQGIQNRAQLQDPAALKALRAERLAGGKTSTSSNTTGSSTTTGSSNSVTSGANAAAAAKLASGPSAGQQNLADTLAIAGTGAKVAGAVL